MDDPVGPKIFTSIHTTVLLVWRVRDQAFGRYGPLNGDEKKVVT